MSEERFSRIETMLADIIRIIGNTNTIIEEIKYDQRCLRSEFVALGKNVESFNSNNIATKEDINQINDRLDYYREKIVRQDEDIYRLKRLIGIK